MLRILDRSKPALVAKLRRKQERHLRQLQEGSAPDLQVAIAQIELAVTLDVLGLYEEAEGLLRSGLRLATSTGDRGTVAARAQLHLSDVLWELGRRDECTAILRELVEHCRRTFGDGAPDTVLAMVAFGFRLWRRDQFAEAEEIAKVMLAANQVMGAMQSFADIKAEVGEFDEAEYWQREVLSGWQRTFGEANRSTIIARIRLADMVARRGDHEEALLIGEPALRSARSLSIDRAGYLIMARVYRLAGQLGEANKLVDRVLTGDIGEMPVWRDTTTTLHAASARALHGLRRYPEARVLEEKVLRDRVELLGEGELDSVKIKAMLGQTLRELGDTDRALELQEQVLATMCRDFGEDYFRSVVALKEVAITLRNRGELARAGPLADKCLLGLRRLYGDNHRWTQAASELARSTR